MSLPPTEMIAALALTRFGLGARPGDIADARRDPRGSLVAQIDGRGADQPQDNPETSAQRFIAMPMVSDWSWPAGKLACALSSAATGSSCDQTP